jgi:serine/threonine protein phosphatase PrpC
MLQEIITDGKVLLAFGIALGAILLVLICCILIKVLQSRKGFAFGGKLTADVGNAQTIGTREKQDDSFATSVREYGIMGIVADGIGGYLNGNLASRITVDTFLDEFEKRDVTENLTYFFQKSAMLSNERIRDEFGETKGGTTAVSVILKQDKLFWTSVGDSNISVFRGGRIIPVNRKENVKNWLEDRYYAGSAKKEEVLSSQSDTRLVNYLGYDGFKKADESDRPIFLKKKDKVLLYSDGVEVLGQIELENILSKNMSAQKTADTIIEAINAKKKNKKDNATILIFSLK